MSIMQCRIVVEMEFCGGKSTYYPHALHGQTPEHLLTIDL